MDRKGRGAGHGDAVSQQVGAAQLAREALEALPVDIDTPAIPLNRDRREVRTPPLLAASIIGVRRRPDRLRCRHDLAMQDDAPGPSMPPPPSPLAQANSASPAYGVVLLAMRQVRKRMARPRTIGLAVALGAFDRAANIGRRSSTHRYITLGALASGLAHIGCHVG